MSGNGPLGLTPGCYLVNAAGTGEEETVRVTSSEFSQVLARGLAKEHHGMPPGYRLADVRRGMVARIDEDNKVVVEPKGTHHERLRRGRDRYAGSLV